MKNKTKRLKRAFIAITLAVVTIFSTSFSVLAGSITVSGSGATTGNGNSMSGSYLVPRETDPAVGYRFAVITSAGLTSSAKTIDIYCNDYTGQYQPLAYGKTDPVRKSKQETLKMSSSNTIIDTLKKQDISSIPWNNGDIEAFRCSELGLNSFPKNPSKTNAGVKEWLESNNNSRLNKILAQIGSSTSSILSDKAMVSVEPIYEAKISNNYVCGTITDIAVLLGQLNGNMNDVPDAINAGNQIGSISRVTNKDFPNLWLMQKADMESVIDPTILAWYGKNAIVLNKLANFSTLIQYGYGVGICYGKKVTGPVTVRYHDRQETTYNSAHIIKSVQIPRDSTFNLTLTSTLGLTNGDYNFKNWIAYDNGDMNTNTSRSDCHFWGYKSNSGDGWYTKNETSTSYIVGILDGNFLSSTMTNSCPTSYIDLYPVWETTPHKNIRYYKDYESYQNNSEITYTIYDPQGTHANTQLTYLNGAFTQTAPLLFPNASIDGGSGHGAFTEVLTADNTTNKYRTFSGWVVYNTGYKRWGGMYKKADGSYDFKTYATYDEAAKNPISESILKTYFSNTSNDPLKNYTYVNEFGDSTDLHRFNAYFGQNGKYKNLGDFYVVGAYTNQSSTINYRTAMTDSDTIEGYLKSNNKTVKDDFEYYLSGSTGLISGANVTSRKDENRSTDVAYYTYFAENPNDNWWINPGYPWDTSDPYRYLQNSQEVDSYKANIEKADYSILNLSDCYSGDQLDAFASLGEYWEIEDHLSGFEFGGWTFAKCRDSNYNDTYFGYSKGTSTPGWHLLKNIDTTRTNSDTSYYGFYVFQPDDELTESFLRGTNGKSIDVFSLWKELPTYTVNYYEDGNLLSSQNIPASDVIKAQTKGEKYAFYSRYNKRLNSSPDSAYDYLGWSYDDSAEASPNIGFDDVGGNNSLCYAGYENYSPWTYVSSTAFTWQTDSNGNKYLNLYSVKSLKPNITVKYNPNGDMDYVANNGDRDGITGTMNDITVRSDIAITNGISLDSCAYVKESYTFNKWVVYSSQMNGYYGKRAGATSYEWITNVNEVATFKTISSTDTLFTSESAQFLKDTGVTSGDIILYAAWDAKYDVYYTTQRPAGSNIVSNYDANLGGNGYSVHQEYSFFKSFTFLVNEFEDKSGNYEYKGWSVYIVNSSNDKTYYCDNQGNKKIYQANNIFPVTNLADLFGGVANIPGTKVYVEAQWEPIERPNSIIVKYNPNGDMNYVVDSGDNSGISGVMSDEIYTVGADISIADNLYKKTRHSHNGWVLYSTQKAAYYSTSGSWTTSTNSSTYYVLPKSDGKLTFDGILNGITDGELILYAAWKPNTYTIKYNPNADANYAVDSDTIDRTDANGVKITGEMADTVVTYGVSTKLRDVSYQYPNHTFVGWVAYRTTQKQYYVYADESLKNGKWVTVDELKNYTFGDYSGFYKYSNEATVSKTSAIDGDIIYMFAIWKTGSYTIRYNPNADENCVVDNHSEDYIDSNNVEIVGEMPDQIVTCGVDQEIRDIYGIEDIRYYYMYPNHRFVGWIACRENASKTAKQYYAYTDTAESSSGWVLKNSVNPIFGGYNGYRLIENQDSIGKDTLTGWTITLFAVWETDACSVQFVRNTRCGLDDYVIDMPNSVQVKKESEFIIPSGDNNTPKLSNSNELVFIGWNTESKGTGTSYGLGSNVTLEGDLILYAQWRIQLDISVEKVYYSTDLNGTNRIDEDIKLKEDSSYFTFLKISNNSQFFDVTFNFASNVSIAGRSLQSTSASGISLSNDSQFDLCSGRITVTPPSEASLVDTFFTADSAIVKFAGNIVLTSVTYNGESTWTYSETNIDNNSKKLEKNFLINAPNTFSYHKSPSHNIYSGQLIQGAHRYCNQSLFSAVFNCFARKNTFPSLQLSCYDENYVQCNDTSNILINEKDQCFTPTFSTFDEPTAYRYKNTGKYPISFNDAYSRMSWVNSDPEIFGESNSTLTVYPIDLIAEGANIYKEGVASSYNKGVSPGESYSVTGTYILKTMLNPIDDLHANIRIDVFGITADGEKEHICSNSGIGLAFFEYTVDEDEVYTYKLQLSSDTFTVNKKYTGIYINGYIYDANLMYSAYSTFFEQSGTNNTFEMSVPVISPFTIEFIEPNAYYTKGKEVVSGFTFKNNSPYNLRNDVGYTISVYDTNKIKRAEKSGLLGVPSSNTTMIWIKWTVPKDMSDIAYIKVVADTGAVYNTTVLTAQWYVKDNLVFNTPDTAYSDEAPNWYDDSVGVDNAIAMSSYNLDYYNKGNDVNSFIWNYFIYDNATDSYRYVTNEVSVDGTAVISKKGCPDTEDGSIKSGYGYGLNVNTFITSTAPDDAVTDCQNAYVAFPEFNNAVAGKADSYYEFSDEIAADYLISASGERNGFKNIGSSLYSIASDKSNNGSYGTFATLKKSGYTFELPINSSTGDATHFIPIWMPDGDYEVTGIVDEIWTPMGMISKKIVSNTLQVSGNMYDDFKVSHYTIKQAE